ncbi:MAG: site-specific integrase [Gammaproteobacteria bacterium]|nr:site-specific integrase [Gemmatimonadales bacterium]MYJ75663.1 site-specific integrase [Gammaproteobacteria bacterium]
MSTVSHGGRAAPEPMLFEAVAEEAFRRYRRMWKPATLRVNRVYLRNQIMPGFGGRPVADITRSEVRQWFGKLHATPSAANRSLPILSIIMRQAEAYGYRPEGSNPCTRIRRYREARRERFLTTAEIRRLGRVLADRQAALPLQVAIVRLLLVTGCRQSEIRTLQWGDYREGHLFLRDSKTGPRTVWLSSAGRRVLDQLTRARRFVFPASGGPGPMSTETLYCAWRRLRVEANLPGLRLHDLRHTYASFALRRGENLVMIGRLLGHRDPDTTLKYTHFGDLVLRDAVETVAEALGA